MMFFVSAKVGAIICPGCVWIADLDTNIADGFFTFQKNILFFKIVFLSLKK